MGIIKALKLGFDYQRYDDDGNVVDMQRAVNDVDLDIKAGEFGRYARRQEWYFRIRITRS